MYKEDRSVGCRQHPICHFHCQKVRGKLEQADPSCREKIDVLLKKFECSYRVSKWFQGLQGKELTAAQYESHYKEMEDQFIKNLGQGGALYLPSGWHGMPAGHHIALELVPYQKDGKWMVYGRVINRGDGLQYHEKYVKGDKPSYNPELFLDPISLDDLCKSSFFKNYFQLKFISLPDSDNNGNRSAAYGPDAFYQSFLPSWPAVKHPEGIAQGRPSGISVRDNIQNEIGQRSSTCLTKPLTSEIKKVLGEKSGKIAKFYLDFALWESIIQSNGITSENVDQIEMLLGKLSRRALKIKKHLPQDELQRLENFDNTVKEKIASVRQQNYQDCKDYTTPRILEGVSERQPSLSAFNKPQNTFHLSKPLDFQKEPHPVEEFIEKNLKASKDIYRNTSDKYNLSLYTLRHLPKASDPVWKTMKDRKKVIENLNNLLNLQFKNCENPKNKHLIVTPQDSCLWVKTLSIIYCLGKDELPQDLRAFYANGLKNLIEHNLANMFTPLDPIALDSFKEALAYITADADPKVAAALNENIGIEANSYSMKMGKREFWTFDSVIKDPELKYLYNTPQFKERLEFYRKQKAKFPAGDALVSLYRRHSNDSFWDWDYKLKDNDGLTEWKCLRTAFNYVAFAFKIRSKSEWGYFNIEYAFEQFLDYKFYPNFHIQPVDDKNPDKAVYSDAFPGITSDKHEAFAMGLLSPDRNMDNKPFPHHSDLGRFYDPLILKDEQKTITLTALEKQDLLSARTLEANPLLQIEYIFSKNLDRFLNPYFQTLFMNLLFNVKSVTLRNPLDNVESVTLRNPLDIALSSKSENREVEIFFSFLQMSLEKARTSRSWSIYCFILRAYAISLANALHYAQNNEQRALINQHIQVLQNEIDVELQSEACQKSIKRFGVNLIETCFESITPYLLARKETQSIAKACQCVSFNAVGAKEKVIDDYHMLRDAQYGKFLNDSERSLDQQNTKGLLPNEIILNDVFKRHFALTKYPILNTETNGFTKSFEIQDEKGDRYRLVLESDELQIKRLFCEGDKKYWYTYSESKPLNGLTSEHPLIHQDGYLCTNVHFWHSDDRPNSQILVLEKNSGKKLCSIETYRKFLGNSYRIKHPVLENTVLLNDYTQRPILELLHRITPNHNTLAWKDEKSNVLKLIELKEYDVQFESQITKSGETHWMCSQHPGFYIDDHSKCASLEPLPHYLVLRNAKGERKVLMPSRHFDVVEPTFFQRDVFKQQLDSIKELFTFQLDANSEIILPEQPLALQYLIYIGLVKPDYKLGFRALNKLKRNYYEWDDKMKDIMSYFDNEWKSPFAAALRLQVVATQMENTEVELNKGQKAQLALDYGRYLNGINNIIEMRLSQSDEALIVAALPIPDEELPDSLKLLNKVVQLKVPSIKEQIIEWHRDPQSPKKNIPSSAWEWKDSKLSDFYIGGWSWIDKDMEKAMISAKENPVPILTPMFPGTPFLHNLLYYYDILSGASKGLHSQKEVLNYIHACKSDPDPRIKIARALLLHVYKDRGKHPKNSSDLLKIQPDREPKNNDSVLGTNLSAPELHQYTYFESLFAYLMNPFLLLPSWLPAILSPFAPLNPFSNLTFDKNKHIAAGMKLDPPKADVKQTLPMEFAQVPDTLVDDLCINQHVIRRLLKPSEIAELHKKKNYLNKSKKNYKAKCIAFKDSPPHLRKYKQLLKGVKCEINSINAKLKDETLQPDLVSSKMIDTEKMLKDRSVVEVQQLEKLADQIKKELNNYKNEIKVEKNGNLLTPLTLEQALVHLGKRDDTAFYRANPKLTPLELKKLKELLAVYLLHKLNAQKTQRTLAKVCEAIVIGRKFGSKSPDYAVAKEHANNAMKAQLAYPVNEDNLPLMVFEAYADMRLREEQVTALRRLSEGNDNLVYEARTGFGKSMALIPLWLFMTSRRRKNEEHPGLAVMTVPTALYPQQIAHLRKILGDAYDETVYGFKFTREMGNNLITCKFLNHKLKKAAETGTCVLTTPSAEHNIHNKIVELLMQTPNEDNTALLIELQKLAVTLKCHTSMFLDESRECLDPSKFHDYAYGRAKSAPRDHCSVIKNMFAMLMDLKLQKYFDFLPDEKNVHEKELTKEEYDIKIRPHLIDKVLLKLQNDKVLPQLNWAGRKAFIHHMQGNYDKNDEINSFLDKMSLENQRTYSLYREQIYNFLPQTLTRQCNDRYALAYELTGDLKAYPCDRGVPQLNSQFATPDHLYNFTTEANLKSSVPISYVSDFLTKLNLKIVQKEYQGNTDKSDPEYQCFLAIQKAAGLGALNLADFSKQEIEEFTKTLNNSIDLKLLFIENIILPKIILYNKKISSTSHNLVENGGEVIKGACAKTCSDTDHYSMKSLENLSASIAAMQSVLENSQDKIHVVRSQDSVNYLRQALRDLPQYSAIIDTGGDFRDIHDDKQLAGIIFEETRGRVPPVDAVSYYDAEGNNLVYLRPKPGQQLSSPIQRKHCTVPIENIFVFIRKSSTIGSDTPMPMTLNALWTLGGDTTIDFAVQGWGRLRGLLTGQKIGILIQDKYAHAFKNENGDITIESILDPLIQRQAERLGQDVFYNLNLVLHNLLDREFRHYFRTHSIEDSRRLAKQLEPFLVEDTHPDHVSLLRTSRKEMKIEDAVKLIKNDFKNKYKDALANTIDVNQLFTTFDSLIDYKKLPKIVRKSDSADVTRVVEVGETVEDNENENMKERDNETEMAMSLPSVSINPPPPLPNFDYKNSNNYLSIKPQFNKKFESLFDGISISPNFLRYNKTGIRPTGILKTSYQYLVVQEGKNVNIVLVDQADTQETMEKMGKGVAKGKTNYYLVTANNEVISQDASSEWDIESLKQSPRMSLLLKVFTRTYEFDKKEIAYLASLSEKERKLYYEFFQEVSFCWVPEAQEFGNLEAKVKEKMKVDKNSAYDNSPPIPTSLGYVN